MNQSGKQGVEQTIGCQSDTGSIGEKSSDKVCHDHSVAAAGDSNRLEELQKVVAQQHGVGALARIKAGAS